MDFRSQITQLGIPLVTAARALTVSAPLTGGGDLSADRTLGLSLDTTLLVSNGSLGVSSLVSLATHTHTPASLGAEPALGSPAGSGYVLTSTAGGVRSWAAPTVAWGGITGRPTTLGGFGITDAQPLDATLTALSAAAWSAGTQVLTLTAVDTVTMKTVGSAAGNILDRAAGDVLYLPLAGNAATATKLQVARTINGVSFDGSASITVATATLTGFTLSASGSLVIPNNVIQNQLGYAAVAGLPFSQGDGGLYTAAYDSTWMHQIFGDFRSGQIAVRGKNNNAWQAWRNVLDSSNYTSYAPTLTGAGASGTWGINISGSAATAMSATSATTATYHSSPDGDRNADTKLPTTSPRSVRFDFVSAASVGLGGNYAGLMTYAPWDGTTASTGDASYQLAFGSSATNGGGYPRMRLRKGIDSTWGITWYEILHAGNIGSYAPSTGGSGAFGTWGIHITGNANYATSAGSAGNVAWTGVTGKPTTLGGYGITDAISLSGGSTTGGVNLYCSYFSVNATHYIGTDVRFGGHFAVASPQAYTNVRIHTVMEADTSGYYGLIINTANNATNRMFVRGDGQCWANQAWTIGSDRRLKQDITPDLGALQRLLRLSPVRYRLREDVEREGDTARIRHGLIAQEVVDTWPELVTESAQPDGRALLGVDYTDLIGPLVAAVQELAGRFTQLESLVA